MKPLIIEPSEAHYSEPHQLTRKTNKHNNKRLIKGVYQRFLELPVPIVLAGMWIFGAALIVLCVVVLYLYWLLLAAGA